jgi:hypothetical protein
MKRGCRKWRLLDIPCIPSPVLALLPPKLSGLTKTSKLLGEPAVPVQELGSFVEKNMVLWVVVVRADLPRRLPRGFASCEALDSTDRCVCVHLHVTNGEI